MKKTLLQFSNFRSAEDTKDKDNILFVILLI